MTHAGYDAIPLALLVWDKKRHAVHNTIIEIAARIPYRSSAIARGREKPLRNSTIDRGGRRKLKILPEVTRWRESLVIWHGINAEVRSSIRGFEQTAISVGCHTAIGGEKACGKIETPKWRQHCCIAATLVRTLRDWRILESPHQVFCAYRLTPSPSP